MSPTTLARPLALALLLATIGAPAFADTIVIRADADRAASDPGVAMIVADVRQATAERDAYAAGRGDGGFIAGSQAIRTAKRAGLADGVHPWRAYLEFDATEGRVVWRVMNTLEERQADASGRAILLDAASGDVVSRSDWSVSVR